MIGLASATLRDLKFVWNKKVSIKGADPSGMNSGKGDKPLHRTRYLLSRVCYIAFLPHIKLKITKVDEADNGKA
jgi:hypothetical protein